MSSTDNPLPEHVAWRAKPREMMAPVDAFYAGWREGQEALRRELAPTTWIDAEGAERDADGRRSYGTCIYCERKVWGSPPGLSASPATCDVVMLPQAFGQPALYAHMTCVRADRQEKQDRLTARRRRVRRENQLLIIGLPLLFFVVVFLLRGFGFLD